LIFGGLSFRIRYDFGYRGGVVCHRADAVLSTKQRAPKKFAKNEKGRFGGSVFSRKNRIKIPTAFAIINFFAKKYRGRGHTMLEQCRVLNQSKACLQRLWKKILEGFLWLFCFIFSLNFLWFIFIV
jgi:hypothetical protein